MIKEEKDTQDLKLTESCPESDPKSGASQAAPANTPPSVTHVAQNAAATLDDLPSDRPREHGGQDGPEPTRYGDWEKKGRCTDF
ncbi:MAG: DUF1674 domain-containing protein [Granulosicoccus sp.]